MSSNLSLAKRVALLFECITHPDGRRYTYDDVRRLGNVDPSTISRIRTGRILDPAFSNIAGMASAFGVSLDYFSLEANEAELRHYLMTNHSEQYITQLRERDRHQRAKSIETLAHRASYLDEAGIQAVVGMINYVLTQKGVSPEDPVHSRDAEAE